MFIYKYLNIIINYIINIYKYIYILYILYIFYIFYVYFNILFFNTKYYYLLNFLYINFSYSKVIYH